MRNIPRTEQSPCICGYTSMLATFFLPFYVLISLAVTASATEPPITDMTFSPDGKSVLAVSQTGVQIFNWPDLQHQRTLTASAANLHCVVFSPDGNQFAVGGGNPAENGSVEIFSWPTGTRIAAIGDFEDSVTSITWQDAQHLFAASLDRSIRLFEVGKQKLLRTYEGHSRGVSSLCLSDDSETLVSVGDDQSLRVWNTSSGQLIRNLNQHTKPICAVAKRPAVEGLPMVASAAGDRTIRFWQPTIGRLVRYVRLEAEPLDIAWLNDGSRIVAVCVDGRVRVVDPNEVTVTQNRFGLKGWAYAIAIHPVDNRIVVGGSDGQTQRIKLDLKSNRTGEQ